MIFENNDRIVFIGDSITDSNRNYGAKLAGWSSWGDGFVNLINAYTTALLPQKELMIINQGISGDRVVDLKKRWEESVLSSKADWVTIMIGINDVWRHFDGTFCQEEQVTPENFECIYRELIEKTIPKVKGIILLSPYMVESNESDKMRIQMDKYRQIVKGLAQEFDLLYGDIQKKIDIFLEDQSSYVLSSDRIHLSTAGHLLIAKMWLETVGIVGENND